MSSNLKLSLFKSRVHGIAHQYYKKIIYISPVFFETVIERVNIGHTPVIERGVYRVPSNEITNDGWLDFFVLILTVDNHYSSSFFATSSRLTYNKMRIIM